MGGNPWPLTWLNPMKAHLRGRDMLKGEENGDRSVGLLGISVVSPDRWRWLAAGWHSRGGRRCVRGYEKQIHESWAIDPFQMVYVGFVFFFLLLRVRFVCQLDNWTRKLTISNKTPTIIVLLLVLGSEEWRTRGTCVGDLELAQGSNVHLSLCWYYLTEYSSYFVDKDFW